MPIARWFREPGNPFVDILSTPEPSRRIPRCPVLSGARDRFLAGDEISVELWAMLNLELWRREFLTGDRCEPRFVSAVLGMLVERRDLLACPAASAKAADAHALLLRPASPGPGRRHLDRLQHPIDAAGERFPGRALPGLVPEAVGTELEEARRRAHRFTLLGHPVEHGKEIAWSRDPVSGSDWSRGFSPDIRTGGRDAWETSSFPGS